MRPRAALLLLGLGLTGCLDRTPFGATGPDDAGIAVIPATVFLEPGAAVALGATVGPTGGGGVGSACAFGPAACQSHLCLKKDSGNVCTRQCVVDADCPAQWVCAEEKTPDGTLMNVCLPPGTTP